MEFFVTALVFYISTSINKKNNIEKYMSVIWEVDRVAGTTRSIFGTDESQIIYNFGW